MSVFVTDTHPIVWFTLGKRREMSAKALAAFENAEAGSGFIYVPAVVLWEATILEQKGRIKLAGGFLRWTETNFKNSGFGIAPLEPAAINSAVGLQLQQRPVRCRHRRRRTRASAHHQRRGDHRLEFD